jgi:hypothetical protein
MTISGAQPNSPVTTDGSMPGVHYGSTPFGFTDSNGGWGRSGVVGNGDVGDWAENWYVGGSLVGTANFTVTNTPNVVPVVVTPVIPLNQTSGSNPTGDSTNTTNSSAFTLFGDSSPTVSLPVVGSVGEYTALGVAALLVMGFMFMSKGERHG